MDFNSLQFRQLQKHEIPLVAPFYKQVYKKGAANKSDHVFILKAQQILCAARLKEVQGHLLLTGVACAEKYRGQGLASLLITNLLTLQQQDIYCFPYPHLQTFYQQLGFELSPAELLPAPLALQYQRYHRHQTLLSMVYSH